jgi:hypothetical protein
MDGRDESGERGDARQGMKRTIAHSFSAVMRRAWAGLHLRACALLARERVMQKLSPRGAQGHEGHHLRELLGRRPRVLRKCAIGAAVLLAIVTIPIIALSWRLASGPVPLDLVTPWLTSAVEDRFGGRHRIEVGGTQLERTEEGGTAIRMRDIVVRDPDGTEVARAPKAEVGISGFGLLTGRMQAERLSLIGVTMAVRVEPDGQVSISAGAKQQPIGTARTIGAAMSVVPDAAPADAPSAVGPDMVTAALAWLADLDALGLDGQALTEIGLKNGSLVVDDRRGGKQWNFDKINLSVTRPKGGGVAFALNSVGADGPWSLTATVTPRGDGRRAIEAVVRDISPNDLFLALRIGDGHLKADMPVSGILRAEIGRDGMPSSAEGKIIVKSGYFLDPDNPEGRVVIEEGQVSFKWDAENRKVVVPIELLSGGNRFAWLGQVEAPRTRRARPRSAARDAAGARPHLGARPLRSGQASRRDRPGRRRWCCNRRIVFRRARLVERGAQADRGACDHEDDGVRDEADVADLHPIQDPIVGRRAPAGWHRRPRRDGDQCAAGGAQGRRAAGRRGRPVDRHIRHRRRRPADRRIAPDSRCRHGAAHDRAHRDDPYGPCRR